MVGGTLRKGEKLEALEKLNCNIVARETQQFPSVPYGVGVAIWRELTPIEIRRLSLCYLSSTSEWIWSTPGEGKTLESASMTAAGEGMP